MAETSVWERLRAPFPVEKLRPVVLIDAVNQKGERWVTLQPSVEIESVEERLDEVAPGWTMEVLQLEAVKVKPKRKKSEDALPVEGFYALVRLQVAGVVRDGVGFDQDPRAAVSMAFKNAALRFGVGRYLRDRRMLRNVKVMDERALKRLPFLTWEEALERLQGEAPNLPPRATPAPKAPAAEEDVPF